MRKHEREPMRKATRKEREYVLKLDPYADNIRTDGVSLFWEEPGDLGRFSTQRPPKREIESYLEEKR